MPVATIPKHIQLLIDQKKLALTDWETAVVEGQKSQQTPEIFLVAKKMVSEEDLAKARSELFELPYIDLREAEVPSEVVSIIGQAVSENYQLAIFEKVDKELKVAMVDPANYRAIEAIDFWAKKEQYNVTFYICSAASWRNVMKNYKELKKEVSEALGVIEERKVERKVEQKKTTSKPLTEVVKRAPVAQIVAAIGKEAVEAGASDIHIEPYGDQVRVRFRVDGVLRVALMLPIALCQSIVSRIKILASLKIDETRIPQDGRIHMDIDGGFIDLRVSTLPVMENEKVVMRLLPVETHVPTLQELGFWYGGFKALQTIIDRPTGVLLISGPTGSGKTTTLHSMLNTLNREGSNIVTLEDPVEYYLNGVNQVQIHHEVGLTFASGLRAILRQDPNIVMVGEIRDRETAELAIQAALTGHFMLSTIHSKDVIGIIPRLIDMGVEPFLIAASMNAMSAQRLVRKICEFCKEPIGAISQEMSDDIKRELAEIAAADMLEGINTKGPFTLYRGKGCEKCNGKGYKGRTVIAEVAVMTEGMRELVRVDISLDAMKNELKTQGMVTLKQDGLLKALRGIASYEDVLLVTRD